MGKGPGIPEWLAEEFKDVGKDINTARKTVWGYFFMLAFILGCLARIEFCCRVVFYLRLFPQWLVELMAVYVGVLKRDRRIHVGAAAVYALWTALAVLFTPFLGLLALASLTYMAVFSAVLIPVGVKGAREMWRGSWRR